MFAYARRALWRAAARPRVRTEGERGPGWRREQRGGGEGGAGAGICFVQNFVLSKERLRRRSTGEAQVSAR
jgi:hypothetical protein